MSRTLILTRHGIACCNVSRDFIIVNIVIHTHLRDIALDVFEDIAA